MANYFPIGQSGYSGTFNVRGRDHSRPAETTTFTVGSATTVRVARPAELVGIEVTLDGTPLLIRPIDASIGAGQVGLDPVGGRLKFHHTAEGGVCAYTCRPLEAIAGPELLNKLQDEGQVALGLVPRVEALESGGGGGITGPTSTVDGGIAAYSGTSGAALRTVPVAFESGSLRVGRAGQGAGVLGIYDESDNKYLAISMDTGLAEISGASQTSIHGVNGILASGYGFANGAKLQGLLGSGISINQPLTPATSGGAGIGSASVPMGASHFSSVTLNGWSNFLGGFLSSASSTLRGSNSLGNNDADLQTIRGITTFTGNQVNFSGATTGANRIRIGAGTSAVDVHADGSGCVVTAPNGVHLHNATTSGAALRLGNERLLGTGGYVLTYGKVRAENGFSAFGVDGMTITVKVYDNDAGAIRNLVFAGGILLSANISEEEF
jgi:hypothetical protein